MKLKKPHSGPIASLPLKLPPKKFCENGAEKDFGGINSLILSITECRFTVNANVT